MIMRFFGNRFWANCLFVPLFFRSNNVRAFDLLQSMKFVQYSLLLSMFFASTVITAQTCNVNIIKTKKDERYLNAGDGTVMDLMTGLMWQQCSVGQNAVNCNGIATTFTWQEALQQAETINSNGGIASYTDWRLPNHNELRSLVEIACDSPAINNNIFPNTSNVLYWSSSPYAENTGEAWTLYFGDGFSLSYGTSRNDKNQMRLVRSGL